MPKARIVSDHLHVHSRDLPAFGIAGEETGDARVRLHHPQQHVGGFGRSQVKLLGDGLEVGGRAELLLVLGEKQRDAEERVVELIERLALLGISENLVVELGDEERFAGAQVVSNIIEDARFGVTRLDGDGCARFPGASRECEDGHRDEQRTQHPRSQRPPQRRDERKRFHRGTPWLAPMPADLKQRQ